MQALDINSTMKNAEKVDVTLSATSKLVKAWESKTNQRAMKAGGGLTMALTLAACGGSDSTTTTTPVVETPATPAVDASKTVALTTGSDDVSGGTGDDTFTATGATLTSTDSVSGLAGTDVLTVVDTTGASASGWNSLVELSGIETLNVTATGTIGVNDVSAESGTAEVISLAYTAHTSGATTTYKLGESTVSNAADATANDTTGIAAAAVAVTSLTALYANAGYTVVTAGTPTAGQVKITSATDAKSPVEVTTVTVTGAAGEDIPNPSVTAASASTNLPAITNGTFTAAADAVDEVVYNISSTGVESFIGVSVGGASVKASSTQDVTITNTGNGEVNISGGDVVVVNDSGSGVTNVIGSAISNVTLNGGTGAVVIDNLGGVSGTTTETGTTLTEVTLNKVDANSAIKGANFSTLNMSGATATTNTVIITNGTANHALTVNVDGTGYNTAGEAKTQTVADANATSMVINANGSKSDIDLVGATLANVTVNGTAAKLNLNTVANTVDKLDAFAFTGGLTVTMDKNLASGDYVKTGAGNDTVALGSKTLTSTAAVDLGAGDDSLSGTGAVAATAAVSGGAGTDTVTATLINNTNKSVITGFEKLDVAGVGTASYDYDLAEVGNTGLDTVTVSGNMGGNTTLLNFTVGDTIEYTASSTGQLIINEAGRGLNATSSTKDELSVEFNAVANSDGSAKTVTAALLDADDIDVLNIVSDGGAKVSNVLTTFIGDELATVNITGDNKMTMTNVYSSGSTDSAVLKTIDASASTGGLVVSNDIGNSNIDIKLGSGDDTITLGFNTTASSEATSSALGADQIYNFEKATAATVADGKGYDQVTIVDAKTSPATIAVDADAAGSTSAVKIKDGVVDFSVLTSGPTTLAAALDLVDTATGTDGDTVLFEYGGSSYLFSDNGGTDLELVVELVDVTGVTALVEGGTDTFYIM